MSALFNATDQVAQGWYWLLRSNELKRGKIKPVRLMGYDLAVFRGKDGQARALAAHCPHMGAHLAEGHVEGNEVRCFFHNWRFDGAGQCSDIPCLDSRLAERVRTQAYRVFEAYGLIWVWIGEALSDEAVMARFPVVPELGLNGGDFALGNRFKKGCHPNVVMINAIDEQHFRSVHLVPGEVLSMQPVICSESHIAFENRGELPQRGFAGAFLKQFYKTRLTYNLSYYYGHVGVVTAGPDFLHVYLMFALRLAEGGKTEGQTLAFTKKRKGLMGLVVNPILLWITKLIGGYFAIGDTRVFETIRFDLKTPIAADRAIIAFMAHMEQQEAVATGFKS